MAVSEIAATATATARFPGHNALKYRMFLVTHLATVVARAVESCCSPLSCFFLLLAFSILHFVSNFFSAMSCYFIPCCLSLFFMDFILHYLFRAAEFCSVALYLLVAESFRSVAILGVL